MPQKFELILSDTLPFVNLLKFKNEMIHLKPGDLLEVRLSDEDTVNDLEKIVNRSEDRIAEKIKEGDLIKISILKGNNTH